MTNRYPKLNQSIRENIVESHSKKQAVPGYGIVMSYNPGTNRATVLMSSAGSDQPGELYQNVICPTTIGIQGVAPEVGRPAWVVFKNNNTAFPIITNFFNHVYDQIDYTKQTQATNSMPRFMTIM